jgi:hypothetical protein
MALDTSIYGQYLRPVKSVADYDNEFIAQQQNALSLGNARQVNALNAMKFGEAQRQAQEAGTLRNALAQLQPGATIADRIAAAEGTRTPTGISQADAWRKSMLEAEKERAGIGKTNAETMKAKGEALDKALSRNRDLLNYIQDPVAAARWAESAFADPDLAPVMQRLAPDAQTYIQSIPTDPQGFANWKIGAQAGADKLRELLAREMEGAQKTANDTMIPDGKGGFMVNKPLQAAKQAVASAGKTTVSVNTAPKAFWSDFGKANVDVLMKEREGAVAASGVLQSVVEIRKAAEGGAYQGVGAELKLNAAKALGALGMPYDQQTVANSEVFDAQAKQFVLNSIKQLGANPSNTDREFIEKTVPSLRTDPASLPRLLTFLEGKARSQIRTFNDKAKRVQSDPAAAQMPFQIEVPEPDAGGGWGITRKN